MLNLKVTVESISKETGRQHMTLGLDEFIKLNKVLNKLADELNQQVSQTNLIRSIEQGLLVNELCKRPGVQSFIIKNGIEYAVVLEGEYEKVDIGPANIIIISNLEGGER